MIKKEVIEAYALKNALEHDGKAMPGAVINSLFAAGLNKAEIPEIMPKLQEVLKEVNSLSLENQKQKFQAMERMVQHREEREGLPELENAIPGKVVMRFAPFPSGALHIGNARPCILNDEYCKKYRGKFILMIDDTIGSAEKQIEPAAYDLIKEGVDWLGVKRDKKVMYKSDRLGIYYKYSEEMLEKGWLYVCSCPQEEMKKLREKGIECSCRNLPKKTQLARWKEMQNAKQGDFTVRLKTDMHDSNPAFRDRVMFKISDREHPRTGKKYTVWPTMEFSWAIDDHLLGITHVLRGIELMMESRIEEFMWKLLKWPSIVLLHTGSFEIGGIKLSKSKGAREVNSGEYIGWNDPRTWSLQAIKDRGILPESIREFCASMGMTRSNSSVSVDMLYAINRRHLNMSKRYFFVPDPVKIEIDGCPKSIIAKIPLHPSEDLGHREYKIQSNEFYIPAEDSKDLANGTDYRLLHLLNFKHTSDSKKPGNTKNKFLAEKSPGKMQGFQWLTVKGHEHFSTVIRMPDNSLVSGLAESEISKLKVGDVIQFERFGFVRLYSINIKNKKAEFWFAHP